MDLGAAYVGPTQNRLLRLARLYGVQTYLTHEVEDLVVFSKVKAFVPATSGIVCLPVVAYLRGWWWWFASKRIS